MVAATCNFAVAEDPPPACAGGETFQFEAQGSTDGGYSWSSDSAMVFGKPGETIEVTVRTLMTVTSGQTEGWSFSLEYDDAFTSYYGGSVTLNAVTTAGTDTETVKNGSPPDMNRTDIRGGFKGYTQGVLIDTASTATLAPTAGFVTSLACYTFTMPSYSGTYDVKLTFTHDVGSPAVRSVIAQDGESDVPCAKNFTFYLDVDPLNYTTPGGCSFTYTAQAGTPPPVVEERESLPKENSHEGDPEGALGGPCAIPPGALFLRGDANSDEKHDISDGLYILNWLFGGGPELGCLATITTGPAWSGASCTQGSACTVWITTFVREFPDPDTGVTVNNVILAAGALVCPETDPNDLEFTEYIVRTCDDDNNCSFGDIAVGPNGEVMVTFQDGILPLGTPEDTCEAEIFAYLRDPADPADRNTQFVGGPINVNPPAMTKVCGANGDDLINAKADGIWAAPVLAWDRRTGAQGRIYLGYLDEIGQGSDNTDIILIYSDAASGWQDWFRGDSPDDPNLDSQFLHDIAVDQVTGYVALSWYDTRMDPDPDEPHLSRFFATYSTDGGANLQPSFEVSYGADCDGTIGRFTFGDYTGLDFHNGVFFPAWGDNSIHPNSNNPDGFADVFTSRVEVQPQ